jgi:uncharacterized repeat protein (TIGR01451 family)
VVTPTNALTGEIVTYTLVLRTNVSPVLTTAYMTDTIPAGLEYVTGTLTSTLGLPDDSQAPTLKWEGVPGDTKTITITYAVKVTETEYKSIENTAEFQAGKTTVRPSATVAVGREADFFGSTKVVTPTNPLSGEIVTYTLVLRNNVVPLHSTVYMTDTIPAGLEYVIGTLTSTLGLPDDSQAPTLKWKGQPGDTKAITITYAAKVTETEPKSIENTAVFRTGTTEVRPSATVVVVKKPQFVYLPIVLRQQD